MIQPSDIIFVLSNGSFPPANSDPNESLGFTPSNVSVGTSIENLFENITNDEASIGKVDYRCFYVFNDSSTDDLPETYIYFDQQLDSPTQLSIGINTVNDVQTLTINGTITGGNIVLNYDGNNTAAINYSVPAGVSGFATAIANGLNALSQLSGVTCTGTNFGTYQQYTIAFGGNDGNRYQPLLLVSNNLTGSGLSTVMAKTIDGSPINSIAPLITSPIAAPAGINFIQTSISNRKLIGLLRATEGFPVWVRRAIPAGTNASNESGAVFKLSGTPN